MNYVAMSKVSEVNDGSELMPVFKDCQIFTPPIHVKTLLDVIGYKKDLYGKKVAENSCGDGNILYEIVKRYIEDCLRQNLSLSEIRTGLNRDVWAAEIDVVHIDKCKKRLDALASEYGINNVIWNIYEGDVLRKDIRGVFDFVIGNPPYINYHDLDETERKFVRSAFATCAEGKFDYCYAFIEAGLKSMNSDGKMAYLIPSNIFKNRFAERLRGLILPYITDIYDYTREKLFSGRLTSSAIMVCNMASSRKTLTYHDIRRGTKKNIVKSQLNSKWIFSDNDMPKASRTLRFGDYFNAASTVVTQLNEVFIISDFEDHDTYVVYDNHKIEKGVLMKAVSPRAMNNNKKELIIFPYYYAEDGLNKYSLKQFEQKYPEATLYLKSHKEALDRRNSDRGAQWFEYGRSQALLHLDQDKLLISTLVTGRARVYMLERDIIPTSGIYIVPKKDQQLYSLAQAKALLESDAFIDYVSSIGVISNGTTYRITSRDINEFRFPESAL